MNTRHARRFAVIVAATLLTSSCGIGESDSRPVAVVTGSRDVVITTVPLLTRELAATYPFLKKDFAKGGVLDGKELYEFMPSTITVVTGDTLQLTFINPEDDPHSFVMKDLAVSIPGQSVTHASYVARNAGIFDFVCAIPAHMPMMRGQIVVLPREVGTR